MCQCADVTWETANLTSSVSAGRRSQRCRRSDPAIPADQPEAATPDEQTRSWLVQDIRELALMLKRDLTGSR
jgi:hypothetical protein